MSEHRSENISNSLKYKFSQLKKNGHMIGRPGFGKKAKFIKNEKENLLKTSLKLI